MLYLINLNYNYITIYRIYMYVYLVYLYTVHVYFFVIFVFFCYLLLHFCTMTSQGPLLLEGNASCRGLYVGHLLLATPAVAWHDWHVCAPSAN